MGNSKCIGQQLVDNLSKTVAPTQLAAMFGVADSTVNDWKKGATPCAKNMAKIHIVMKYGK